MSLKSSLRSLIFSLGLATSLYAEDVYSATKAEYVQDAATGIKALNSNWYSQDTGLWDSAWWHSANALTTLADFAILQPGAANSLGIANIIQNTVKNAPKTYPGFISKIYEDEGCGRHLRGHADGGGTPCNGGIFMTKNRKYVNAVANELYLTTAAALANRIPSNRTYAQIASNQWKWFQSSGLINGQNLINDGLDGNCKNNGLETWTINQGVILGALVELSTGALLGGGVLNTARALAKAAIKALSDADGILVEIDHCETKADHCGAAAKQYKGIFIRNLGYLNQVIGDGDIRAFILKNADSVWSKNRDANNRMGVAWAGPVIAVNGASHSSALDALVAAARVA
ncbi:hypothetical protein PT974_01347 [Cladobotryum mycophilum]|uniref:Mannan endo-1,6-alpha-mannosidase n=1 Tax=Cladobotryum mycophilum TaxID=491253 RepID=A0ABR0T3E2_9HYPO